MDFARKQLEKYGWKEGQGLGKKETGITAAIKPNLKFDKHGLGHDLAKEFANKWWEQVYNTTANNIDILTSPGGVTMKPKNKQLEINKKVSTDKYSSFVKRSTLTGSTAVDLSHDNIDEDVGFNPTLRALTDEELFKACNGRTAHKGARHGLKLVGKLSRLEKQEKLLLKKLKNVSLSDDKEVISKKIRKLNNHREICNSPVKYETLYSVDDSPLGASSSISSKKKKKSARRVSFCETVVVVNVDKNEDGASEDTAGLGARIKDANHNEVQADDNEDTNASDEGIEKDLDESCGKSFGHVSFEEAQAVIPDKLSKEERKLLKKKRKLEKYKKRATMRFLEEMESDNVKRIEAFGKKRKFQTIEDGATKKVHLDSDPTPKGKWHVCKKQLKREERQMNSIVKSLGEICTISDEN